MRETEMRRRIERVLATAAHGLLLPGLGLGLALSGCGEAEPVYGAPAPADARGIDLVVHDGGVPPLDTAIDGAAGVDVADPADVP